MFDVGFAELFLLALVGLLVLGPERLPKAARTLGGLVRKARTSWFALRRTIESELAAADVSESVKSVGRDLKDFSRKLDEIHQPGHEEDKPAESTGEDKGETDDPPGDRE